MKEQKIISAKTSRRVFMRYAAATAGAAILIPKLSFGQAMEADSLSARARSKKVSDKGAPLDENMVFDFVHKSHFNIDVVKKLLAEEPQLVYASWDWGSGDIENGLGAASHVGDREIALFLIANGARANIFAATMLGHLDIVKGFLTAYPDMINTKGPHGLSLVHHAKKGGEPASAVLAYLNSLDLG